MAAHLIFTICSANYLAHARVLGDSIRATNPQFEFTVGLVDRPETLREVLSEFPYRTIPVADLRIPAFADMARRYNVVELSTAVKPFYLLHFYETQPDLATVTYLDPDTMVFGSLRELEARLRQNPIVVTPHSCTYDDSPANIFFEVSMLRTGVYNLGFVATARAAVTLRFLRWWSLRLVDHCYYGGASGLFVDQLWIVLAPVYFPEMHIERSPGYNMCYWNHFERTLGERDGTYYVNDRFELVFFHFSSFDPNQPHQVTSRGGGQPLVDLNNRADLKSVYALYAAKLQQAGHAAISKIPWGYRVQPAPGLSQAPWSVRCAKSLVRSLLRASPTRFNVLVRKTAQFLIANSRS